LQQVLKATVRVELLPEQPHGLVVEVVVGGDAAEGEGGEGPLVLLLHVAPSDLPHKSMHFI